jgi:hypothetical protein
MDCCVNPPPRMMVEHSLAATVVSAFAESQVARLLQSTMNATMSEWVQGRWVKELPQSVARDRQSLQHILLTMVESHRDGIFPPRARHGIFLVVSAFYLLE